MGRGNIDNLVPNEDRTPEERRENARKAGKASAEARRRKKFLKECLEILLERDYVGDDGNKTDGAMVISAKVFQAAADGNIKAFEVIRDTIGQAPIQRVETVEIPPETYQRVMDALQDDRGLDAE